MGEKNKIEILEQVRPKNDHDFPSWLFSSKTVLLRLVLSSWIVICLVHSLSQICKSEKGLNHLKELIT